MNGRPQYSFADSAEIGESGRAELLGGKGAALARMTVLGLPVPPGFTFTTATCNRVLAEGWTEELDDALVDGLRSLETMLGRSLGSTVSPLLVSVRSGSPVSMPGMMDTVLNAGMTDEVAGALGIASGDEWFGWDTARRFVQSYSAVVLGAPPDLVARLSIACLGADEGRGFSGEGLATATQQLRTMLAGEGFEIPTDPVAQITAAVAAVFASWNSDRARVYREVEGIDGALGTAATIQAMTFGNLGTRSGTGVAFTRDPSTGAPGMVGDFLVGAQGEDVVAGTHATRPVAELRDMWPEVGAQLDAAASLLERDLCDLADIEFTVEEGVLWLLQVRQGKRSPRAALRIAIDMAESADFPITRDEALARVARIMENPPTESDPSAVRASESDVLARGIAASPGRVMGRLCIDLEDTIAAGARGEAIILVRRETSPADIAGMAAAAGLITTLGGLVSHAAVVARSWGVPAVVGAGDISVVEDGISVGERFVPVGELLTIDGELGEILLGDHRAEEREIEEVRILRRWQEERDAKRPPAAAAVAGDGADAVSVEEVERVLALKGMASSEAIAGVLGVPSDEVSAILAALVAQDAAKELPGDRVRPLAPVVARVDERFALDAGRLGPVIEPLLEDFHAVNDRFKIVVTSWQIRDVGGDQTPNDHSDSAYDASVVDQLRNEVHTEIVTILRAVAASEPRFARYTQRLVAALESIDAGDGQMMAHPLRDSYHTVWFELHEELIRLTGRNRADEAAAGRA